MILIDANPGAGTLTAIAAIISALAWPVLILILVIWFRKPIFQLLKAVVGIAESANTIKIWQIEFDRNVRQQLETSTQDALKAPIAPAAEPRTAVATTLPQLHAASSISTLLAEAPTPAVKDDLLGSIREKMLAFAQEYESTRAAMPPGSERTRAMNVVAAKMRTLGLAAVPFTQEFSQDQASPGKRLAAICILQMAPDLKYLPWLCERISTEQPFVFYQASIAILYAVRRYATTHRAEMQPLIQDALQKLKDYPGTPDPNTVHTLNLALQELEK